jgi:hypothetical protein
MLKVGFLTSWNTRCGIAEYSRSLIAAMERRRDVAVTVFGSRNTPERAVREYEDYAVPTFDVQLWRSDHAYGLDVDAILAHDLDVLHVQYSNLFYNRRKLVDLLTRFSGLVALTYHDKIVGRRTFPYTMVDLLYAHREDVGIGPRRLIPQGIDVRPPVIKTFGLGKGRTDLIREICDRNGWRFEESFGKNRWLEHDDLYAWLRDSDAIVLWYEEDLTSGGSAAAPLAIATRRPVFVNTTEWFRDIPSRTTTLRKVGTTAELEQALQELLVDPYADERSWDRVAHTLMDDYEAALGDTNGNNPSRKRRRGLRARLFALLDSKPLIKAAAWVLPIGRLRRAAQWTRRHFYSIKQPADR